ncbi:18866_t:CDS:2, partial [Racocetra persica]
KVIEIKQIGKRYGDKTVLNNISFVVEEGTITGFIGPNGAGKTTTLKIMMRLVLATQGDVYINGRSVKNDPTFNERLGFIPAEPRFPNLTVEKYILDCAYLRDVAKEEVLRKLSNSPLNQFRYHNLLLMDEPFNGLDPDFRKRLFDILVNIRKEGGTIFLSTHILPDLQRMAQNVVMIRRGKIVYKGLMTDDIEKTYEEYFIEEGQDHGLFEL